MKAGKSNSITLPDGISHDKNATDRKKKKADSRKFSTMNTIHFNNFECTSYARNNMYSDTCILIVDSANTSCIRPREVYF